MEMESSVSERRRRLVNVVTDTGEETHHRIREDLCFPRPSDDKFIER